MEEDYRSCENLKYVGKFNYYKLKPLGTRKPKTRYKAPSVKSLTEKENEFEVEVILESRMYLRKYQYLVQWIEYEKTT
jgi:hypothetical protein